MTCESARSGLWRAEGKKRQPTSESECWQLTSLLYFLIQEYPHSFSHNSSYTYRTLAFIYVQRLPSFFRNSACTLHINKNIGHPVLFWKPDTRDHIDRHDKALDCFEKLKIRELRQLQNRSLNDNDSDSSSRWQQGVLKDCWIPVLGSRRRPPLLDCPCKSSVYDLRSGALCRADGRVAADAELTKSFSLDTLALFGTCRWRFRAYNSICCWQSLRFCPRIFPPPLCCLLPCTLPSLLRSVTHPQSPRLFFLDDTGNSLGYFSNNIWGQFEYELTFPLRFMSTALMRIFLL